VREQAEDRDGRDDADLRVDLAAHRSVDVHRIVGFAPFKITGWQEPGNTKNDASATPSCVNILTVTCQGIQGYFVRSVVQDPEQVFAYDKNAPDLGGVRLSAKLTN
jgi:hypothetical protein